MSFSLSKVIRVIPGPTCHHAADDLRIDPRRVHVADQLQTLFSSIYLRHTRDKDTSTVHWRSSPSKTGHPAPILKTCPAASLAPASCSFVPNGFSPEASTRPCGPFAP